MSDALRDQILTLLAFLDRVPLTVAVRDLEGALDGCDGKAAAVKVAAVGVDGGLLAAAVATRRQLGRLNDLIHASAIALMLPTLLEPGELVQGRPSLAAGNDPTRPYDLQTNTRVAEFKLAQWTGADAMRKRDAFKDLVHLAADESRRRAQLFVLGQAPIKFLRESTSTALWGLDRATSMRGLFERRFGPLTMSISEFTAGPGAQVELVDLTSRRAQSPELGGILSIPQPTSSWPPAVRRQAHRRLGPRSGAWRVLHVSANKRAGTDDSVRVRRSAGRLLPSAEMQSLHRCNAKADVVCPDSRVVIAVAREQTVQR